VNGETSGSLAPHFVMPECFLVGELSTLSLGFSSSNDIAELATYFLVGATSAIKLLLAVEIFQRL